MKSQAKARFKYTQKKKAVFGLTGVTDMAQVAGFKPEAANSDPEIQYSLNLLHINW